MTAEMLRPTAPAPLRETGRGGSGLLAVLLGLGFALAVGARVAVGGSGPARSPAAGLVFAGLLVLMALAARTRVPISVSAATWGVAGAVLLSAPVALMRIGRPMHAAAGFASWAVVVAVVATAEELFLRGALYDAVRTAVDERAAIVAGAVGFAALHVPLYGWHVVPLDLIVGLVLGELRRASGTPAAPAVTHVGADLAAWFLR